MSLNIALELYHQNIWMTEFLLLLLIYVEYPTGDAVLVISWTFAVVL